MFIQDNSIAEETKHDHLPRTAHPALLLHLALQEELRFVSS